MLLHCNILSLSLSRSLVWCIFICELDICNLFLYQLLLFVSYGRCYFFLNSFSCFERNALDIRERTNERARASLHLVSMSVVVELFNKMPIVWYVCFFNICIGIKQMHGPLKRRAAMPRDRFALPVHNLALIIILIDVLV